MPYYPEDQSEDNLKKLRRNNVCSICGRQLYVNLNLETKQQYLACPNPRHEGISREYQPQREDYETDIRRSVEMEEKIGHERTRELAHIPMHGQLTQPQAMHILKLVYPRVPDNEIIRCAIFCRDFGLHPLAKEVFLIPFKETWVMVVGIPASRKMAHALKGEFSFLDDTPRAATDAEIIKQFGSNSNEAKLNIISITKLKGERGNLALGFGLYLKTENPKGMEKGNTQRNMANIRSERQATDRLPGRALPKVEVVDDAYIDAPNLDKVIETTARKVDKNTGEIIEGEFKEVEPEPTPEPEEVHHCEEHDCDFELQDGKYSSFYSHTLPGKGNYCNEKDQKKKVEASKAKAPKPKPKAQASIEPSDGPTAPSSEPPESTPEVSEGNGIPKTTEELYLWVAKMKEWPDSAPARSFLVNKVKIEEAKIDSDPTGVYHETKALMGWI